MLTDVSLSGNSRRYVLALIAAAIVGAAILLAYLLWSSYRDALAGAERTTRNYAWLIEASFDAALRRTDTNLKELAETVPPEALGKATVPRFAARLDRDLDRRMRHFPEIDALRVYDAAGDMLYTSAGVSTKHINIADRPYFQRLRDHPRGGLVFSEVLIGRAAGRPAIIVARSIYDEGRFAGAVVALINLEYFQHLFESVEVGRQGLIAVRRTDDFTLALRRPMLENEINQPLPPQNPLVRAIADGKRMETVRFSAQTDGVERIFSIRTLQTYPYYIIAGLATEEVLAGWRSRSLGTGLFGILLLGLLGFVLVRLVAAEAQSARIVGDLARSSRWLVESEAALNTAQAVAHVGSWTLDIADNRLLWSDETYRIFGIAPGTPLTYELFLGQVHPDDRAVVNDAWSAAMKGTPYDLEHRLLLDGAVRWVRERAQLVFTAAGQPISGVGTVQDITERKQAEQQLQLLARVFQHSWEALMVTDHDNRIVEVNPAFTRQTGYRADEVRGHNPRILAAGRTPPETYRSMWAAIRAGGFWQGEVWDRRKDGGIYLKLLTITVVADKSGAISHHIASFTDITQQKATEEKIRRLALHDALTGLPNRLDLKGRLEQALAAARRDRQQVAVMFLDLDRFKLVNDSLGHKIGDLLLIEVAQRLTASIRDSDIVARLGGDEFVVVLPNVLNQALAARMADKIIVALDQPYLIEGHQVESSPSIGIALFPADGEDDETLLKRADEAMYRAKGLGRNNWQFFAT